MVSIARVSTARIFNVTNSRVQISSDGTSLKARTEGVGDTSDEVLTSALARGEVVLLSPERATRPTEEKVVEQPAAEAVNSPEAEVVEPQAEEQPTEEATGQAEEAVSQAEEAEASEEDTKTKKSSRAKVAKEN